MKILLRIISATILMLFILGLGACFPIAGDWKYKEISRIKSPDLQVEAVLVTGDAGATTSTETFVIIVPTGGEAKINKREQYSVVFEASHLKNLNIVWKKPQLLEIHYDEARIDHFKNLREILERRDSSYSVEIRLAPSSPDFSVPLNDRVPYPVHK